jgi:hypothetical protein
MDSSSPESETEKPTLKSRWKRWVFGGYLSKYIGPKEFSKVSTINIERSIVNRFGLA